MKKTSLKNRILNYARNHSMEWINGGVYERFALEAGYKSSNASRRCREMESGKLSDGKTCPKVLIKEERNGSVWYKYKPVEKIINIPVRTGENTVRFEQKTIFQ